MASAQKCGGVQKNTTRNSTTGAQASWFGDRGPADQRREAAGGPAPDDVLGGAPLEHHRVADDVEDVRGERQAGREPVDEQPEPQRGDHARARARRPGPPRVLTMCRGSGRRRVRRIRSSMSASYTQFSALALPADRVPPSTVATTRPSGGTPPLGQEHHRHRGEQQQLDDPRLGQPDVGTEHVAQRGRAVGPRRRGHLWVDGGQEEPLLVGDSGTAPSARVYGTGRRAPVSLVRRDLPDRHRATRGTVCHCSPGLSRLGIRLRPPPCR